MRLSQYFGGGLRCPDCQGRQFIEFCPPRAKGWCVSLGECKTCKGVGYLPVPQPPQRQPQTQGRLL